jgi:predicted DNA-binding transcriptional regulator YafY
MRADRLLSILMLLQARGKVTAERLAEELEVSVRTIYRDVDALSSAGVPVYAERGPGGGCALVEGYRTSLTGLTADEVKALFMLSVPSSLDELGMSQELRVALRKLAAALPETHRQDKEKVRQRIHLDWSDWSRGKETTPYLQTIHRAVWEDLRLHMAYREFVGPQGFERFERLVDPYGLVAKAGTWHLVCTHATCEGEKHLRVYRVSRILDARITDEHFERPVDFDLAAFWKSWCVGREETRPSYPATVRVSPELAQLLPLYFGDPIRERIASAGPPDADGWITLTLPFECFEEARRRILGFGRAAEVLAPEPLRLSVIDFARQIADFYRT